MRRSVGRRVECVSSLRFSASSVVRSSGRIVFELLRREPRRLLVLDLLNWQVRGFVGTLSGIVVFHRLRGKPRRVVVFEFLYGQARDLVSAWRVVVLDRLRGKAGRVLVFHFLDGQGRPFVGPLGLVVFYRFLAGSAALCLRLAA